MKPHSVCLVEVRSDAVEPKVLVTPKGFSFDNFNAREIFLGTDGLIQAIDAALSVYVKQRILTIELQNEDESLEEPSPIQTELAQGWRKTSRIQRNSTLEKKRAGRYT